MQIKKILWPTDLSGNAEQALPLVESLSKLYSADIHVLYVIEELARHEPWYGEFDNAHINKILEWEKEKAGERLDRICDQYLKGCPLYIKETAIGDPAEEILAFARKQKIDMVVMSSRGRKSRFDFGSVAEKMVKHSPVPVTIVPYVQS
ncbi:universal stress protein [Desulfatitalea alkaliphila]|uniref:Universal stress protein n=1 Tax=Desulfatitalea alkaliphila TaxID=2929485 RepID=A0AA41QY07_9BACT|nr:universal stress protein [Desulfatitalea alkaliphila]MCJ8499022.1 universal stress protein [Desulfatitalea alkaliphila]